MVWAGNKSIAGRGAELLPVGRRLGISDRAEELIRISGKAQSCPVAVGGTVDSDQRNHDAPTCGIGDAPEVTLHRNAVVRELITERKVGAAGAICPQSALELRGHM